MRITKEIAIVATFGTGNKAKLLFAVLAELDGTGVPVTYFFVEKCTSIGSTLFQTTPHILDQFLRPLLGLGFNKSFVDCDKDKSEINALRQV